MRLPGAIPMIEYDDRVSLVSHLDELRSRLIVALCALAVAFGFCFWQNHHLLHLINAPLVHQTEQQVRDGQGPLGATYQVQRGTRDVAVQLQTVVRVLKRQPRAAGAQAALADVERSLRSDVARLSAKPQGDRPITLRIGEPFTTTVTVTLISALILALPLLLAQAYGFLLPAFEPRHRRELKSLGVAIPVLFIIGVAFGYLVVLPAAVRFFENFNSEQFNVLVQASQYYKFAATTLLAMGLIFELPVAILAVTRAGVTTPRQLRRHRRYAVAGCALVAALLPGDAVTMLLETLPLYVLFEGSVLMRTTTCVGPTAMA